MDEAVKFKLDWKIASLSLNTTAEVTIHPKNGLKANLDRDAARLIEKELEQACSRIHSIVYQGLS